VIRLVGRNLGGVVLFLSFGFQLGTCFVPAGMCPVTFLFWIEMLIDGKIKNNASKTHFIYLEQYCFESSTRVSGELKTSLYWMSSTSPNVTYFLMRELLLIY